MSHFPWAAITATAAVGGWVISAVAPPERLPRSLDIYFLPAWLCLAGWAVVSLRAVPWRCAECGTIAAGTKSPASWTVSVLLFALCAIAILFRVVIR
jgi:hypothetical protein